jgi:proline iminopeptidase
MFPEIEPFEHGMLDVGDAQSIYWECCGNLNGHPVLYLHGGPGSGCTAQSRRYLDPATYRIILTDQRGCGRSRPHVEKTSDLDVNTTSHLIADLERLRQHLGIESWAILGGSWGSTLALAYAQAHPQRVSAMVLASVTTTSQREVTWITHDVGRIFPEQWETFASVASNPEERLNLASLYNRLLFSDETAVQERAARQWCAWEETHVSLAPGYKPNRRFGDPVFRLRFARLVTHYWSHHAFLREDQLIRNASRLDDIRGVLIHGRYDVSSPLETAWRLHRAWENSSLHVVDDAGHGGGTMPERIAAAMNQLHETPTAPQPHKPFWPGSSAKP